MKMIVAEILKEATIHFLVFDESHFSNIFTLKHATIECIEINLLRKYRKNVRSSQSSIPINSCTEFTKLQFSLRVSLKTCTSNLACRMI